MLSVHYGLYILLGPKDFDWIYKRTGLPVGYMVRGFPVVYKSRCPLIPTLFGRLKKQYFETYFPCSIHILG